MKQYYQEKLHWVFNYTSKNFFYVVAKTLCLVVGLPLFAVSFVLDMVLTAVYMLFSFILSVIGISAIISSGAGIDCISL